jgi:hypothetical protein
MSIVFLLYFPNAQGSNHIPDTSRCKDHSKGRLNESSRLRLEGDEGTQSGDNTAKHNEAYKVQNRALQFPRVCMNWFLHFMLTVGIMIILCKVSNTDEDARMSE